MNAVPEPKENHLLASMPPADWEHWRPQLEWIDLSPGTVLYDSTTAQTHVYFLTTAVVSLSHVLTSGVRAEVAVVGCEGVVGVTLFMGGESMPGRAVVQRAGQGYRLKSEAITNVLGRSTVVMRLMLRYTQVLIAQMTQTAQCNHRHSLDQQLCRLLLLSLDRSPGKELVMTSEHIAERLGVRRDGVTEVSLILQSAGLVRYSRTHITVLDREGLNRRACKCYSMIREESLRMLPERIAT